MAQRERRRRREREASRAADIAKLRQLRKDNGGKLPGLELGQAAFRHGITEGQMRRLVNDGDPDRPPKHATFEFTRWLVMLAYAYGLHFSQLHRDLLAEGIPVPRSLATFWRAWIRVPEEVKLYGKKGAEAHRKLRLYVSWQAPHRNAVWQIDCCKLDTWILPKGYEKPIRPWLIAVIDDHSRMILAWMVVLKQPTGEDAAAVLAAAMRRRSRGGGWYGGRPAAVRWDNGNEFLNKFMTHFVMTIRFDAYAVAPYEPTARGKIERLFCSIQRWALRGSPGYSRGPRTKNKEDVFLGKRGEIKHLWNEDQLVARLANRIDYYNFERPHRALARRTPYEVWCADTTEITEVPMAMLRGYFKKLAPTTRKFTTLGVAWEGVQYTCLDLPEGVEESNLISKPVWLRTLPHDLSEIEVFSAKNRWLCTMRPESTFSAEEIHRHRAHRDADHAEMEAALREGVVYRNEAASRLDPETGDMPTIVSVAVEAQARAASEADADNGYTGQLLVFERPPTVRDTVAASRRKAARRTGPRRLAAPPQDTALPL